jgi:Fe-S-cluster containining protein
MVFGRIFAKKEGARFNCVYEECESLCCKDNLVVLNEDDVTGFKRQGIILDEVTNKLDLNRFLEFLGKSPIKQLEGLQVLQLKKDLEGRCVFLIEEGGGCKIYDQRPYYCREFPFKFSKGKIKSADPRCPGLNKREEKDIETLKKILGLYNVDHKPPYLVGDERKLKTSRALMTMVFRLLR